ncbi:Pleckstrin-like proteiny domain-containing family A member 5 [Larimichthys crocea]|uniref:Pleckstrin-like proteiny domain-containing family A member 5 n=1 Tax=Larimichthys crocea TaxID=215358 RepID=A0A6G0IXR7_LARCR|nr:Pleckstrin-like proteiny domain-containing family A member 5 [Larimichthys crocea]
MISVSTFTLSALLLYKAFGFDGKTGVVVPNRCDNINRYEGHGVHSATPGGGHIPWSQAPAWEGPPWRMKVTRPHLDKNDHLFSPRLDIYGRFAFHNERKVTCKHPVSSLPSQDNCIFVVNEQSVSKAPTNEKKERPLSTMSEASNYTGGSDYAANPSSPAVRPSRPSKKIHNFGKRSNSIRRNPGAPVIKRNWLYKQDSTGMKLWKKRWFVLSDLCLFYYRDEKEEGILGSILLPSFHISMLSVDDHINRKYAFKATHPNMRTYYFCTDTAKEMESWMKAMTDAALVHAEPVIRLDRLKVEQCGPQEINHVANNRPPLTQPEIQNNERNREVDREHIAAAPTTTTTATTSTTEEERKQRDAERYGFQKDGAERERPLTKINSIKLQPAQAAAVKASIATPQTQTETDGSHRSPQVNGSGEQCPSNGTEVPTQRSPNQEPERALSRTSSMQQLEQWVRTQRGRNQDDDTRSITSYQTLPRNMPKPSGTLHASLRRRLLQYAPE